MVHISEIIATKTKEYHYVKSYNLKQSSQRNIAVLSFVKVVLQ